MSRDPQEFRRPELIQQFKEACRVASITVIITCVGRTVEQQEALYVQGRHELSYINNLRHTAGWMPITEAENRIVTWTMKSKHILKDGKCDAFDFAVIRDGKMVWSVKADVDMDGIPDYEECAIIGESLGLVSGARFKNYKGQSRPDYPHLEMAI